MFYIRVFRTHTHPSSVNIWANIYRIACPFMMDMAIRSRHNVMWVWSNNSGQSFEMKSANMHVKTPQSKPSRHNVSCEMTDNTIHDLLRKSKTYHFAGEEYPKCTRLVPIHLHPATGISSCPGAHLSDIETKHPDNAVRHRQANRKTGYVFLA